MALTSHKSADTFEITALEWKKIRQFCEHGQQISKPSSFGYHHRRLTIQNNDTISWQSKSIPLNSIHQINVGNPPKKLFRKMDSSKKSLWLTIAGKDRSVSLFFPDLKSRNFWIKAITIYMSILPKPLYIKTMNELQSALNLTPESDYNSTQIHYSTVGDVQPSVQLETLLHTQASTSNIEIPDIESEKANMSDPIDDPTPSGSTNNTPIKDKQFEAQQKFDGITDENDKSKQNSNNKEISASNSTESMNVDYATILARRQEDIFRNTVSGQNINRISIAASIHTDNTDEITSFSKQNDMDTFNSTYFNTLSSTQQYYTLSHHLIDVEEIDHVPNIEEIKNNPQKLYVLTNDNGKIKTSDELYNVCIINVTLLLPTNDEEMNIQMIETELDEIYSKLYTKNKQTFGCIVLPILNIFAINLKESCPEIYQYLQQKFQWLINQIKTKNEQLDTKPPTSNGITTPSMQRRIISPAFTNDNTATSLSFRTISSHDPIKTKPKPISIPSPQLTQEAQPLNPQSLKSEASSTQKRRTSRSRTISQDIVQPLPKKLV